ncbi:MAG: glycosyltransferase family 39 protein [Bacteroidia bacterium]|nr:glycosyltransferase family 39 protein [Bacteroidia bacterium]MDW8348310.1 glycosyltransferase family 39 protein [Bacteroidia bacterium]
MFWQKPFNLIEEKLTSLITAIKQNNVAFILFLVVINLVIKSYNLYENSLHTDEVYRIQWGQRTYTEILKMSKKELNPPVYLWVLHTWIKLNKNYTDEVHSRYLSLIFSVLTTVVIFLFGKSYFNYGTGAIAALWFSFNPIQVVYAHNISAYTMITFLFVTSLYITHLFFIYFEHKKWRWILFAGLTLIDTMLIYTHYLVIFGLMAQFLMAIWEIKRNRRAFGYYILTQILMVTFFLPWIPYAIANAKADTWMGKATWKEIKRLYIAFIGNQRTAVWFITGLATLLALHIPKKNIDWQKLLIPLWIAVLPVLGLTLICIFFQPFWVDRYLLYLIPGLIVLLAYLTSLLRSVLIKVIISVFFILLFTKNLDLNPIVDAQVRQLMPYIAEEAREPGTLLIINADYMKYTYAYYFNQYLRYIKDTVDIIKDPRKMKGIFIASPSEIEKVYSMPQWHKIVYVQLHSEIIDPHYKVSAWLKNNFKTEKKIVVNGVGMSIYRAPNTLWVNSDQAIISTSFENGNEFKNITAKRVRSGNFSAFANHRTLKYSDGIQGRIGALHGKKGKIKVSAWLYLEPHTKGNFAVSFFDASGKQYFWQSANIDYSLYEQWQKISMEFLIPHTQSPNDEVKFYFDAYEGGTAFVDDVQIQTIFEDK